MTRFNLQRMLSREECDALVAAAERDGFAKTGAGYPDGYRNNDRLVRDDAELAAVLWKRLEQHLPTLDGERPVGLNPRFRFCRYSGGQGFTKHRDGAWAKSATERTRLTVQFYLNDAAEFDGGETRFNDEGVDVKPEEAMAIVFDHQLWHEGRPVTRGVKYVMRTDVVYPCKPSREREALSEGALREVEQLRGHLGYVWQVIALADGRLASCSRDGTVRTWPGGDVVLRAKGSVTAIAEVNGRVVTGTREDGVLSLTALPDGRVLKTGTDGSVGIEGGPSLKLGGGWAWSAAMVGREIAVGSEDGTLRWVDLERFEVVREERLPCSVRALAVVDVELMTGLADGRVWTKAGLRSAHAAAITSIAAVEGGAYATASEDGTVAIWSPEGERRGVGHHEDFARSVVVVNRQLVTASYDGVIRRWSIDFEAVCPYLRPRRIP